MQKLTDCCIVKRLNCTRCNCQLSFSPLIQRGKRISKVRVLQRAIDYICNMHDMISEHDERNGVATKEILVGDGNNNRDYDDESEIF